VYRGNCRGHWPHYRRGRLQDGRHASARCIISVFQRALPPGARAVEAVAVDRARDAGDATRRDLPTLADQAHGLKSMCVTLGAMEAGRACTALELAARHHQEAEVWPILVKVIEETLAAVEEAKGLL
jgi:Hpt domain